MLLVSVNDGAGHTNTIQTVPHGIIRLSIGRKLYDILLDDLGAIRYENNEVIFNYLLLTDNLSSAMRLMGRVAEAIIVRNCRDDFQANSDWLRIARKGKRQSRNPGKYLAVGTGLISTQKEYPQRYNPGDTQRDIVWINTEKPSQLAMLSDSNSSTGNIAGVQIKVSQNGKPYLYPDLRNSRYEVPVVYFGIGRKNDFDEIADSIRMVNQAIEIGTDFVDGQELDEESYDMIAEYFPLVRGLVSGEIKPKDLLNSVYYGEILQPATIASTLAPFESKSLIVS